MGSNVEDFPEQFVHVTKKVSATNGRSNMKGEGADRGVEKVTFEAGSQLIKLYLSNILLANESHRPSWSWWKSLRVGGTWPNKSVVGPFVSVTLLAGFRKSLSDLLSTLGGRGGDGVIHPTHEKV